MAVERVDAVVGGEELGMDARRGAAGAGAVRPRQPGVSLMVADATFADARPMGEGKHVRFTVESRGARARAVAFGTGGRLPVDDGEPVEATFTLEVNEWNGVSEPRLVLRQRTAGARWRSPTRPAPEPAPTRRRSEPAELVLFALP